MKDIKTKPKTTTKAVQNAPKAADRFAKEAVKDIKTVSKDVIIKNTIDKQLDTRQSEQPQRAEVEATKQGETTYYSAVDTVYQKGKHFMENKLKQHRQQVKTMPKQNTHTVTRNVSTDTKRPFGLDCSGFVTWSFINSGFNASQIGHGTQGQIAKCSRISWSNSQAGDLAFYGDLSHVGIIAGKDADGNILVIHSSSGRNNVVITTNSGFGFAADRATIKLSEIIAGSKVYLYVRGRIYKVENEKGAFGNEKNYRQNNQKIQDIFNQ